MGKKRKRKEDETFQECLILQDDLLLLLLSPVLFFSPDRHLDLRPQEAGIYFSHPPHKFDHKRIWERGNTHAPERKTNYPIRDP